MDRTPSSPTSCLCGSHRAKGRAGAQSSLLQEGLLCPWCSPRGADLLPLRKARTSGHRTHSRRPVQGLVTRFCPRQVEETETGTGPPPGLELQDSPLVMGAAGSAATPRSPLEPGLLVSCVAPGKCLNFSGPHCPHKIWGWGQPNKTKSVTSVKGLW